jgi:Rad3-related DNA helicase
MATTLDGYLKFWPHATARDNQRKALEKWIATGEQGALFEMPTGEGKTSIGLCALSKLSAEGRGPMFYVTPTKTQVEQVVRLQPTAFKMLGRSEYDCLYYRDRGQRTNCDDSPCHVLKCPHRVDQASGETVEAGAEPCLYLGNKFQARKHLDAGGIVVCTTAFFLTNRLLVNGWRELEPGLVVLDEAHRLAKVARGVLEYSLTDYHLYRVVDIIEKHDAQEAENIRRFAAAFLRISHSRPSVRPTLLKDAEIERLIGLLEGIGHARLKWLAAQAVSDGSLDPTANREELKTIETLSRSIPRLIRSLRYALAEHDRNPLNYVLVYYFKEDDPQMADGRRRARHHLKIRSYFVAPIIRKTFGQKVLAYSATIGNPGVFAFETGLNLPFQAFTSTFPVGNTRIWMPSDFKNLAQKQQKKGDLNKALRKIATAALKFSSQGHRSLVVVISEDERLRFLKISDELGLKSVSYRTNGIKARDAAAKFAGGEGDCLVGTAAQYAEGVDLPKGVAPVIFFLRPGYQRPDDPETQFEEQRFGENQRWALWNWRVMMEALQVRGRNIRNAEDVGVCFFCSQQFRRFVYGALPAWLKPACHADRTFDQVVDETSKLLGDS